MKKYILLLAVLAAAALSSQAQTSISGSGSPNPDGAAMLDVIATDKGMLIPRVVLTSTTVAAPVTGLTATSTGLLVYNTNIAGDVTPGFYYWNNPTTSWVRIISGNGNFPTGSGTQNYVTKWNNLAGTTIGNSQIFDNGTSVGIGTTSPADKLDVAGHLTLSGGAKEIRFRNAGGGVEQFVWHSGTSLGLGAGSTSNSMYITSAGSVGIGNSGPSYKLDVTGNTRTTGKFFGHLNVDDTRSINTAPSGYDNEVAFDFKQISVLNSAPGSGTYGGLITMAPWGDNSGDASHQLLFNEGGIFWRQGQPDAASWDAWSQVMTTAPGGSGSNGHVSYWTGTNTQGYDNTGNFFWDAANDRLGVGTATPAATLNTYATPTGGFVEQIRVGGTDNYPSLQLGTYGAYGGYIGTYGNDLYILSGKGVATEDHNIHFFTSFNGGGGQAENNERMIITYNGSVGIGTTSPAVRLHTDWPTYNQEVMRVSYASNAHSGGFGVEAYSSNWGLGVFQDGVMTANFENGGMSIGPTYVQSNSPVNGLAVQGSVGIGTYSPGTKLDVVGGSIRTDNQLISTIATGTAPVAVTSTTLNTNLNADRLDNYHASELQFQQSNRDFPNGTLIQTDIDYSVTNGEPWLLEIEGNSYGNLIPVDIKVQGYIYNNTVINYGGISNGTNITGLSLFNYNGKLCFWFPSQGYWNGYNVFVNDSYAGVKHNRLVSITHEGIPGSRTKEVALSSSITQSVHSGNYTSYGDNLGNHTATTTLNMAGNDITRVNEIVCDQNYGRGLVGVYSDVRYQNVFAMSTSYRLAADGTGTGNMYGLAWTHSNIGGASISGLGHQMLVMSAGDTRSAIGDGVWTKYTSYFPFIYDQQDNGYYWDGNSESRAWRTEAQRGWGTWVQYDANNTAYYVDPDGTNRFNYLGRNYGWNWTEYDWNNTAYYMDLDQVSIVNDMRANIFYDYGNTGYYLDPNSSTRITGDNWLSDASGILRVGHNWAATYCSGGWYCCDWYWWGGCASNCWDPCQSQTPYLKLSVYGGAESMGWWGWSDGRFKKNVSAISGALALVKQMRGVTFDWKEMAGTYNENIASVKGQSYEKGSADDNTGQKVFRSQVGFIAQELKDILPMAVMEVEDKDSTGNVIGSHFSVNYDNIIPVLVEAIKELQNEVEELKAKAGISSENTGIDYNISNRALGELIEQNINLFPAEDLTEIKEVIGKLKRGEGIDNDIRIGIIDYFSANKKSKKNNN